MKQVNLAHIEMNDSTITDEWIEKRIRRAGDERLFFIGEAFRRGVTVETIHEWSQIDYFSYINTKIVNMNKSYKRIRLIKKHYAKQNVWALQIRNGCRTMENK